MLQPAYTNQFQKDLKKMIKRGKDLEKIKTIIKDLVHEKTLGSRHRDHKLVGNYHGRRECHIESDWLLVYKLSSYDIIFERTGSHSDLFK
jgi:mRNA interferase YafQ